MPLKIFDQIEYGMLIGNKKNVSKTPKYGGTLEKISNSGKILNKKKVTRK
jgi:hypothetical protein